MTDEQLIDLIIGNLKKQSPLNLITDILEPNKYWFKGADNIIVPLLDRLINSGRIKIIEGFRYFPATDVKITLGNDIDFKKDVLMYLYNSTANNLTDIKPLLKSLCMGRQEIIDCIRALEGTYIVSDKQWRPYTTSLGKVAKELNDVAFNFRLTPEGEQLVSNKYISSPITQNIDNSIKDSVVITQSRLENSSFDFNNQNKLVIHDPDSETTIKSKILKFFSWIIAHPIVSGTIAAVLGAIIYGLIKGEISIPFLRS